MASNSRTRVRQLGMNSSMDYLVEAVFQDVRTCTASSEGYNCTRTSRSLPQCTKELPPFIRLDAGNQVLIASRC